MNSTKIKAFIERAKTNTIFINGFIFYVNYGSIGDIENFPILTNASKDVGDGEWIEITKWSLSRLEDNSRSPKNMCILSEVFHIIPIEECVNMPGHFIFNYICNVIITEKSKMQYVSFRRKPFIRVSLKLKDIAIKDSKNKYFYALAVGFHDIAKELNKFKGCFKIEAELCMKKKLYSEGYEFCINNFSILEESL